MHGLEGGTSWHCSGTRGRPPLPGDSSAHSSAQYCALVPQWPICSGASPDQPPIMRMYFHQSVKDYILFQFAVPQTVGTASVSWIPAAAHEADNWVPDI